ncbi:MAG TPA: hypothetical protein VK684_02765 [Edaphobacter sp.]|nr:hypothetical protein [Edaphobacter sp.]
MALVVKHAIYGALASGESFNADAFDVTASLQSLFGAVVTRNGQDFCFACDENQTIDFNHGGGVSKPPSLFTVKWWCGG